jgi:hypothetical protein
MKTPIPFSLTLLRMGAYFSGKFLTGAMELVELVNLSPTGLAEQENLCQLSPTASGAQDCSSPPAVNYR